MSHQEYDPMFDEPVDDQDQGDNNMNKHDDSALGRLHPLNFPFLLANACLFIFGVYTIFSASVITGVGIVAASIVLSLAVPVILGKSVSKLYRSR